MRDAKEFIEGKRYIKIETDSNSYMDKITGNIVKCVVSNLGLNAEGKYKEFDTLKEAEAFSDWFKNYKLIGMECWKTLSHNPKKDKDNIEGLGKYINSCPFVSGIISICQICQIQTV